MICAAEGHCVRRSCTLTIHESRQALVKNFMDVMHFKILREAFLNLCRVGRASGLRSDVKFTLRVLPFKILS